MPRPVRTVALLHRPEAGPTHIDWMWSPTDTPPGDDERVLTTLRLTSPPLEMGGAFEAVRLRDHRGRYLWFEGNIGRGLGTVERVWEDIATLHAQDDSSFVIEVGRAAARRVIEGSTRAGSSAGADGVTYDCVARGAKNGAG